MEGCGLPEAQVLAQRWRKVIPPNITGDAPNPQQEAIMEAAAQQIEMLQGQLLAMAKKVEDRETEFALKAREIELQERKVSDEMTMKSLKK